MNDTIYTYSMVRANKKKRENQIMDDGFGGGAGGTENVHFCVSVLYIDGGKVKERNDHCR